MIITNKQGLPENFVNAVSKFTHKKAGYSVTELEKSPRELFLTNRHWNEIEQDVSDMIYSLFGSALHHILQKGEGKDQLVEQYLTADIDGIKLSGMADLYDDGVIVDYKTTSVWTIIYDSRSEDWTKQLNVYKYLYELAGFEVKELTVIALLRDWSKTKAKYDATYPQTQVIKVNLPLWDKDKTLDYIKTRIGELEKVKEEADNKLPFCTAEQRWKREDVYKCMKEGRKSSVKNFANKTEAEAFCLEKGLTLAEFPGEAVKCENYCAAKAFCNQVMK